MHHNFGFCLHAIAVSVGLRRNSMLCGSLASLFVVFGCSDSSRTQKLTPVPLYESVNSPVLSMDGNDIFFDSYEGGQLRILRFSLISSNLETLTKDAQSEVHPVLSPTGRSLAFARTEGPYQHVWIMDTNGGGRIQITFGDVVDAPHRYSDDGSRIFLVRTIFGKFGRFLRRQIMEIAITGTEPPKIVSEGVAVSADGELVISDKFDLRNKQNELWLKEKDGRNSKLIDYGYTPYFSPDGRSLVYLKSNSDHSCEIFIRFLDEDKKIRVATPYGYKTPPLYSHYKSVITFRIPSSPRDGTGGLFMIDPKLGNCVRIGELPGGIDPRSIPTR